ncbi:hypothetical protein BJ912DRAFT_964601 [Pholiota molesta]|nr:hypothetical protein BJ912DRAFT_964601 [Pholiota molesta]
MVVKKPSIHDIIPSELLSEIAWHLTDSSKTLKSLSIASHTWTPAAQGHLFTAITLRSETKPGPLEDLFALLQQKPHLAACVTHLTISEERERGRKKWDAQLSQLLPLFENIRRLHAMDLESHSQTEVAIWYSPEDDETDMAYTFKCFEALKVIFQKLEHADFTRVPISWTQYLSSKLKNLGIWEPYIVDGRDLAPAEITNNPGKLSHIQPNALLVDGLDWATCSQVGVAVKWLLQAGLDVSKLRKLGLGLISAPNSAHEDIMVLFRACARTLRELSITPSFESYSPARDDYTDILDLAILTKLRVLHISAQAGIVHSQIDIEPMLWLLPQLKRFPAKNYLQDIVFACEYTVYETVHNNAYFGLAFESYGELDLEVLTPARFPKLRRFMNYIEDPKPKRNLLLWLLKSLAPQTMKLRTRRIFVDRYGDVYRKTLFPPNAPW